MSLSADVSLPMGAGRLEVTVEVAEGEVLAVMGPNGAGKTTLLRALAGLVAIERGRIVLGETVLAEAGDRVDGATASHLPPERREVGMVFQDYLLFGHMSVVDNVAFGLRARGSSRAAATGAARRWLDRVGIAELAGKRPGEVSGGQAQRVALARALAIEPRLLLLDEPLAALDVATRSEVRRELRRHLAAFDGPTILVTHDPLDALALADRVAVIEEGRVTQLGTVAEVAARPATPYVAQLFGTNLLRGIGRGHEVALDGGGVVVTSAPLDGPVLVVIRPSSVSLHRHRPDTSARNVWQVAVSDLEVAGEWVRLRIRLGDAVEMVAAVTPDAVAAMGVAPGDVVWASCKATDVAAYPA